MRSTVERRTVLRFVGTVFLAGVLGCGQGPQQEGGSSKASSADDTCNGDWVNVQICPDPFDVDYPCGEDGTDTCTTTEYPPCFWQAVCEGGPPPNPNPQDCNSQQAMTTCSSNQSSAYASCNATQASACDDMPDEDACNAQAQQTCDPNFGVNIGNCIQKNIENCVDKNGIPGLDTGCQQALMTGCEQKEQNDNADCETRVATSCIADYQSCVGQAASEAENCQAGADAAFGSCTASIPSCN